MSQSPRWKHRPPGSNWGDFGPDDQNGRLNLITPDKVRQAVAEVREGLTFCLSLPLDLPGGNVLNPRRHPPRLRVPDHPTHTPPQLQQDLRQLKLLCLLCWKIVFLVA